MNFLITGDSWSQGEWDGYPDDYRVTHQGIQQYLIADGHSVTNVGQGGFDNLQSINAIPDLNFDHLIFFYTDPLRQSSEYEIKDFLPFDIINAHKNHIHNSLLTVKQNTQCQITVIGGCSKYQGPTNDIDYLVPSINELLAPDFADSEFMTSREWEQYFFKHQANYTFEQKQQWLVVMTKASEKYDLWKTKKSMFWPDGLHANRHGTLILYNYLKTLWFSE